MATTTSGNLHLTKPAYGDGADIATINSNMDTIDTNFTSLNSSLTNYTKVDTTLVMCNNASNTEAVVSATSISGYKPVAIVGYAPYGGFASTSDINALYLTSTGQIRMSWATAHATSIGVTVAVLYVLDM